jgi:4-hydroxy-2-oxoheptanedioate aldolase
MQNPIREKLARGELVLGMMHFTGSPMVVEVMARAGLDFTIIDMEHSPIDLGLAAHLVRAADAAGITPLVRVPAVDAGLIKKVLNLGARGIVIPHATRADCEAAVDAVCFAPDGERGACPAVRAAGYAPPDWRAFAAEANRETLVIPLLEDTETLADLEKIVALPGVDVLFLGPFDFAISAGVAGAGFDHPVIAAALERTVALARAHGKYVMTSVGERISTDYAREITRRGVQMISFSADALVFLKACRDIVALKPGRPA